MSLLCFKKKENNWFLRNGFERSLRFELQILKLSNEIYSLQQRLNASTVTILQRQVLCFCYLPYSTWAASQKINVWVKYQISPTLVF